MDDYADGHAFPIELGRGSTSILRVDGKDEQQEKQERDS